MQKLSMKKLRVSKNMTTMANMVMSNFWKWLLFDFMFNLFIKLLKAINCENC